MQGLKSFKLAVLQTKCVTNKEANIQFIREALTTAGKNGAQISVLG
jgi:predicted amidohydrolase